jgi:fumarylacetoacetase
VTWLELGPDHPFGPGNLPYGSFADSAGRRHAAVRIGDHALSLTQATEALATEYAAVFADGSLDRFLAAGRPAWTAVRSLARSWLSDEAYRPAVEALLTPLGGLELLLPFTVGDYVDFYASEQHATNVGRIFRPGQEPLTPNWKHLPIGYHGRSGTVVVSGTDVRRPAGQARDADGSVVFGPSRRLDLEAEVGFVVGSGSALGEPVPLAAFADHVFGVCLVNDWSARDIQAWEYVPLGPFLGKSFATSVSAWITPLDALAAARLPGPQRDPAPLPYLDDTSHPWGLDIDLDVRLNGELISSPRFAGMYWTPAQMLAHLTVNGASLRPGDLFASGTVSGGGLRERGSLLELAWGGTEPLVLADGSTRTFLDDGDEVVLSASAPAPDGARIGLGEVRGRITPASS